MGTVYQTSEKLLAGFLRVVKLVEHPRIQINSLVIDSNILTVYGSSSGFQNGLGILGVGTFDLYLVVLSKA